MSRRRRDLLTMLMLIVFSIGVSAGTGHRCASKSLANTAPASSSQSLTLDHSDHHPSHNASLHHSHHLSTADAENLASDAVHSHQHESNACHCLNCNCPPLNCSHMVLPGDESLVPVTLLGHDTFLPLHITFVTSFYIPHFRPPKFLR